MTVLGRTARTLFSHPRLWGLLLCNVLLGLSTSFVSPFTSLFGEHEVGMSSVQFGAFMVATGLAGIVFSTILARWSDTRFSRRQVLLFGALFGAFGYVGYALVRDPVWLTVIGCVFLGLSSVTFSQLFAHAREVVDQSDIPEAEVPLYMNVFRLSFALSWTVGPALASLVMLQFSFVGTYLSAAFCFVALFVAVGIFVPQQTSRRQVPQTGLKQTFKALSHPEVLAASLAFVLVFATSSLLMLSLPLFIVDTLHGTQVDVGVTFSVAPFFELPLMFFIGALASRPHRAHHQTRRTAKIIRLGILLFAAYFVGLAVVRAPWQIYPLQILSAAVTAILQGLAISYFQDFLPEQQGTATNLYVNVTNTGRLIGYILFSGLTFGLSYQAIFLMNFVVCMAAFLLLLVVRRTTGRFPDTLASSHENYRVGHQPSVRTEAEKASEKTNSCRRILPIMGETQIDRELFGTLQDDRPRKLSVHPSGAYDT